MATLSQLVAQWQGKPRMAAVLGVWLDVLDEEITQPRKRLLAMLNPNTAEGVWLDKLGERIGLQRPWTPSSLFDEFTLGEHGWDEAPWGRLETLEARTPVSDGEYRSIVLAGAHEVACNGTLACQLRAMKLLDPDATIVDNHDMTVTLTIRDGILLLANRAGLLIGPAGVRYVTP